MPLLAKGDPLLTGDSTARCPAQLRDKVVLELLSICRRPPWGSAAGMAAPQLGYPYNIFVAQGKIFENVVWVKGLGAPLPTVEGCFSVPHEHHTVERYPRVKVRVGNNYTQYDGWLAQVIQHEFDHIKGILIDKRES